MADSCSGRLAQQKWLVLPIYEIIYLFTKYLQNTYILTLKVTREEEEQQQDEIIFKLFGISSKLKRKLG